MFDNVITQFLQNNTIKIVVDNILGKIIRSFNIPILDNQTSTDVNFLFLETIIADFR